MTTDPLRDSTSPNWIESCQHNHIDYSEDRSLLEGSPLDRARWLLCSEGWLHHAWALDQYAALAAQPAHPLDDLGAAWAEAEAALPEGWVLDELTRLHGAGFEADAWVAKAIFHNHDAGPLQIAVANSPAAALRALAAVFTEPKP